MLPGGWNTLDTLTSDSFCFSDSSSSSSSYYFSYFVFFRVFQSSPIFLIFLFLHLPVCPGGQGWGCDNCDFRRSRAEVEEVEEAMREAIASREANIP